MDKCFKYDLEKVKINHFYKAKLPLSLLKIIIVLTWKSFSFYKFAPCSKDEEDEIEWVRKTSKKMAGDTNALDVTVYT